MALLRCAPQVRGVPARCNPQGFQSWTCFCALLHCSPTHIMGCLGACSPGANPGDCILGTGCAWCGFPQLPAAGCPPSDPKGSDPALCCAWCCGQPPLRTARNRCCWNLEPDLQTRTRRTRCPPAAPPAAAPTVAEHAQQRQPTSMHFVACWHDTQSPMHQYASQAPSVSCCAACGCECRGATQPRHPLPSGV